MSVRHGGGLKVWWIAIRRQHQRVDRHRVDLLRVIITWGIMGGINAAVSDPLRLGMQVR